MKNRTENKGQKTQPKSEKYQNERQTKLNVNKRRKNQPNLC